MLIGGCAPCASAPDTRGQRKRQRLPRSSAAVRSRCSIDIELLLPVVVVACTLSLVVTRQLARLLVIDDEIVGDRRAPDVERILGRMIRRRPVDVARRRSRCRTNTRPSCPTDPARSRNSSSPARAGPRPSPSCSPLPSSARRRGRRRRGCRRPSSNDAARRAPDFANASRWWSLACGPCMNAMMSPERSDRRRPSISV